MLIGAQGRLVDRYLDCLKAVNLVKPFKGQNVIHAPFAPPHHVIGARRMLYFFLSKEISYDSLRKSWAFHPRGLQLTNTPKLPPSYTIVPIHEWRSLDELPNFPAGSLVRIHAAGLYHNALGYVIGASRNQANECALVAVLPKVKYPDIQCFDEGKRDSNPPPKKRSKMESPSHHPQIFDPTRLRIRKPGHKSGPIAYSRDLYATIYDDGFQRFFKTKFPDIESNGLIHRFNLIDFTWLVRQHEADFPVVEQSDSRLQPANMQITLKTPPVYHYRGHFYYLGMQILPIYQRSSLAVNHVYQLDEILPFVEARLAPEVFNPLLSQMHWKAGDKLIDVAQTDKYPFYSIQRVRLEEGVVVGHLFLTSREESDAVDAQASGVLVNVDRLPHECALSTFRLRLLLGDHVKVIAGEHRAICGTVIDLFSDGDYTRIIPYGGEADESVSDFRAFMNLLLTYVIIVVYSVLVA